MMAQSQQGGAPGQQGGAPAPSGPQPQWYAAGPAMQGAPQAGGGMQVAAAVVQALHSCHHLFCKRLVVHWHRVCHQQQIFQQMLAAQGAMVRNQGAAA